MSIISSIVSTYINPCPLSVKLLALITQCPLSVKLLALITQCPLSVKLLALITQCPLSVKLLTWIKHYLKDEYNNTTQIKALIIVI